MSYRSRDVAARRCGQEGVSLVEVVIAVAVFAGLFLALAGATQTSMQLANRSRTDLHVWAATQRTADSLIAADVSGGSALASGSRTVDGVHFQWRVVSATEIQLVVTYSSPTRRTAAVDTLTLHRP
jgi:Tfp pilus assembly protein PilV